MPPCQLCRRAEAIQTGSHLLSAFMVTSMVGERDQETGYFLSTQSPTGHSNNVGADPIKEDFILCRGCEQRLSFLESYVSSEFTQKIDDERFTQNFPISSPAGRIPFKTCSRIQARAFSLLLYSIVWRWSVSTNPMFVNFRLELEIQEDFRRMLDSLLPPYENFKVSAKPKQWIRMLNQTEEFKCCPYIIAKLNHAVDFDDSRNMVLAHPQFTRPYHLLANEYLLLLFTPNDNKFAQDYFELKALYGDLGHLITDCNTLKVAIFTEDMWNGVLKIARDAFVKQQIRQIREHLQA